MSSEGFIKIPRSLLDDPLWNSLSPVYQHIFIIIFKNACYKPRKFDDHGHILDLKPGQLCISEDDLRKLCHKSISENDIHRCIVKLKLYGFLSQKVNHKKSILTITYTSIYEDFKNQNEPISEPNLNQTRTKLEPQTKKDKKDKKVKKEDTLAPEVASQRTEAGGNSIIFSFNTEKFENIRPKDLADWKEAYPAVDIEQELKFMVQWLLSNKADAPKSRFRSFITRWLTRNQNRASQNNYQTFTPNGKQHNLYYQDKNRLQINRNEAKLIVNSYISDQCEIKEDHSSIWFIPLQGAAAHPTEVKYSDQNFKEALEHLIKKYRVQISV